MTARHPGPTPPLPMLGHGVGLRLAHYDHALAGDVARDVDWAEAITENFIAPDGGPPGGRPRAVLERVRTDIPVVLHGVGLGPGSTDAPPETYLSSVRALCDWIAPAWVSDHLCWGSAQGHHAHDLLPLPYTEEALAVTVRHIEITQAALGRRILIENVSSYVSFAHSAMPEWEFLGAVAERADCLILLDLNNIIVSAHNHGFAPADYLAGIDSGRVGQFHLANHTDIDDYKFDDHRGPVPPEVWALHRQAVRRFGAVSSLVEWDADVPSWATLVAQRDRAAANAAAAMKDAAPEAAP